MEKTITPVQADESPTEFTRSQLASILTGLLCALLLVALDQTILTVVTPQIVADFNGFERYAWIATAYLLTSTVAVPIFGKLSDLYGRKKLFLVGTLLFVFASLLCGLSGLLPLPLDGMSQLIVFRGMQGLAGGIINALAFIMIGDIFPPAVRGKYQGLFASVWIFASLVGPTLGGWLAQYASWRWIFYLNVPVGIVATLVIYQTFPLIKPSLIKRAIDYWGIITLSTGLISLMLALTWVPNQGWTALAVIEALLISLVMFVIFVFVELRAAEPIIPLSLFRNSIIVLSACSILLSSLGAYGIILYLPLFMQQVMGMSTTQSGVLLTPALLMLMAGNIIGGMLISRLGRYKWITVIGLLFMAIGAFLLASITSNVTPTFLVIALALLTVGLGATTPLYTIISQNAVPYQQLAVVTAFTQFVRQIGATLGVAIAGAVMLNLYESNFEQLHPTNVPTVLLAPFKAPLQLSQKLPTLQKQFAQLPNGPSLLENLLHNVNIIFTNAVAKSFLICAITLAAVAIANIFLKEIPLRKSNAAAKKEELSPDRA